MFDQTLTYKEHLQSCKEKVKAQVNLIRKLAGTSWGAGTNTLRMATLTLIYSTAEYCAPVWLASTHMKAINV